MKKILLLALLPITTYAQDIAGTWNGTLSMAGMFKLRIVFHFTKADTGYTATMDSPDQKANGLPVSSVTFRNDQLQCQLAMLGATYHGVLRGDSISGPFKQGKDELPLVLHKGEIAAAKRPQEPKKPYPYVSEEVRFDNPGAHITLAGTLTLPKEGGKFPAVILITGSGAQNRDEEIFEHKPFLLIADYLTRRGIAVLRIDDRGTGQSTGSFKGSSTLDFKGDVAAAVAYLRTRKDIRQIGLIGHSEGGIIAPMVAADDQAIAFVVMLAGTGVRGDSLFLQQHETLDRMNGASEDEIAQDIAFKRGLYDLILTQPDTAKLHTALTGYFHSDKLATDVMSPWNLFIVRHDPAVSLQKTRCPVLAMGGDKDVQVNAQVNLGGIERSLKAGGNKDVTIKVYKGLNHLFQESETGSPTEYGAIEQTFSPLALEDMGDWIVSKVK